MFWVQESVKSKTRRFIIAADSPSDAQSWIHAMDQLLHIKADHMRMYHDSICEGYLNVRQGSADKSQPSKVYVILWPSKMNWHTKKYDVHIAGTVGLPAGSELHWERSSRGFSVLSEGAAESERVHFSLPGSAEDDDEEERGNDIDQDGVEQAGGSSSSKRSGLPSELAAWISALGTLLREKVRQHCCSLVQLSNQFYVQRLCLTAHRRHYCCPDPNAAIPGCSERRPCVRAYGADGRNPSCTQVSADRLGEAPYLHVSSRTYVNNIPSLLKVDASFRCAVGRGRPGPSPP